MVSRCYYCIIVQDSLVEFLITRFVVEKIEFFIISTFGSKENGIKFTIMSNVYC